MAQSDRNPIEIFEAAGQGLRQRISGIQPSQMSSSTPCTEWNVQELINHTIIWNRVCRRSVPWERHGKPARH